MRGLINIMGRSLVRRGTVDKEAVNEFITLFRSIIRGRDFVIVGATYGRGQIDETDVWEEGRAVYNAVSRCMGTGSTAK